MPTKRSPFFPSPPVPPLRFPKNTHVLAALPDDIALRCVNHGMSTVESLAKKTNVDLREVYRFPEHEILQIDAMLLHYGFSRG